jgi:hypothetical protein
VRLGAAGRPDLATPRPGTPYAACVATTLEKLEAGPVQETVRLLHQRIRTRFPDRDLCAVAAELDSLVAEVIAGAAHQRGRLRTVRVVSRVLMAVVLVLTAVVLGFAVRSAFLDGPEHDVEWLSLVESGVNDVVFAGIAIWFLWSVPERLQRASMLELLHRLRSLTHIVDMHQLTKDPERLRASFRPTAASPTMDLTPEELEHYLDYCSELLSLIGKAAALCAEESRDAVVLDTVSTIESLTVGMSRKIWQKISALNEARREWAATPQQLD